MENNFKNILLDRKVNKINNIIKKVFIFTIVVLFTSYIVYHIESMQQARLCEIFNDNPEAIINCYFNN